MTEPTIREIHGNEMMDTLFWLDTYAFQTSPANLAEEANWKERVQDIAEGFTCYALFEGHEPGQRAAATVVGTPLTQQVRGRLYGMGGIWGVMTHPARRRRGYSRRLMAHALESFHEQGHTFSCLYPFRESFYERLGYATFPLSRKARLAPASLAALLGQDFGGEVELLLVGEGYERYREFLRVLQERTHGWAMFDHPLKGKALGNTSWMALAKVDGEVVGVMLYDLKGEQPTKFALRATRFYYTTSQGRYLLLEWLARHVDQAEKIEFWLAPYEQPETWWADMQVSLETMIRAPMGRVVDVANIGGMESGAGSFTARISDPLCPWNEGIWRFEAIDGRLQVQQAGRADYSLSIQGLSALLYGTHSPEDFRWRGWGDPAPQAQATMRAMFPRRTPYLHELY